MSFARFSYADVYIFEHSNGFIECCGCWLMAGHGDNCSVMLMTPRLAIEHLHKHKQAGHNIAQSIEKIKARFDDLDAPIEKYKPDPYQMARLRDKLKQSLKEQND